MENSTSQSSLNEDQASPQAVSPESIFTAPSITTTDNTNDLFYDSIETNHPDFPVSEAFISTVLMAPIKQDFLLNCRIIRKRDPRRMFIAYELFLENEGGPNFGLRFLLSATKLKSKTSHYIISTRRVDMDGFDSKDDGKLAKVRSNFVGTQFTLYDDGKSPFKRESVVEIENSSNKVSPPLSKDPIKQQWRKELLSILYEQNIFGYNGPRKMTILLPALDTDGVPVTIQPTKIQETLLEKIKNPSNRDILCVHNKSPQWNEENQSFVLNFNGRVSIASVKNFQIVHDDDLDYIILQFGRISNDVFTLDIRFPLTPVQAFAIALSSFDSKLACE